MKGFRFTYRPRLHPYIRKPSVGLRVYASYGLRGLRAGVSVVRPPRIRGPRLRPALWFQRGRTKDE